MIYALYMHVLCIFIIYVRIIILSTIIFKYLYILFVFLFIMLSIIFYHTKKTPLNYLYPRNSWQINQKVSFLYFSNTDSSNCVPSDCHIMVRLVLLSCATIYRI